jgi:hypothetical protein
MRRATTRGFKRTSKLLEDKIRQAGESRGFAVSRVLTQWAEIVGPDMAEIARPVDIRYGRQGFGATLTVLTTGAQAPMLEMQKEQLRARVNSVYGYNAISRVRITQTAPTGFAEGQVAFQHKKPDAPAPPDPEILKQASQVASDIGDGDLRDALEKLATNVLTNTKR